MATVSFEELTANPEAKKKTVSFEELAEPEQGDWATNALQTVTGALFGNRGGTPLGPVVQTDGGDFYKDKDGNLKAFSNRDYISAGPNGEEMFAYHKQTPEGFLGKARETASALAVGLAADVPGGVVMRGMSKAPKAAGLVADAPKKTATFEEFAAAPKPEPDLAGNINLNKVNAAEDVKEVYRSTAAKNDNFTEARRGTISFEQTQEMAGLVGMSPEKLSKRIRGQAFNAEQMFAARETLVTQATKVKELAKAAYGGSAEAKMAFSEELTRLVSVQEQVSGATAEAGRTLSQFRMMAGAPKERIMELVEAANAGGRLDDIITKVNQLDDPSKVASFASKAFRATTMDKVRSLFYNSVLSGPATHVVNAISNQAVSVFGNVLEPFTAATISKVTGGGYTYREAAARTMGMLQGAKEGAYLGLKAFQTEMPSGGLSKVIEGAKYQAIGGKLGKASRIPSRLLMGADEMFKAQSFRAEINGQAIRQAYKEGLKGKDWSARVAELKRNPTDGMTDKAMRHAENMTFTNPMGKVGSAVMNLRDKVPGAWLVVPFVRTPANIIAYAAKRSLLAPLFREVREQLAMGGVIRDEAIARMAVGSTVSMAAVGMALEGGITGGGPKDPRERALLYKSGWSPYSFKIGDNYVSFGRLEPLGMLMGVAADFVEISKKMSPDERDQVAALMMLSIQRNLANKSWLGSVTDFIEAYNDPDRYGTNYVTKLSGAVVPTVVAHVARVNDPYLREANGVLDTIKSRIPGLRETLPAKRDPVYGEPIKLEGAWGPDIVSPIYGTTEKHDPVVNELIRLGFTPSQPTKVIRKADINQGEHSFLQEKGGAAIKSALGRLMGSPQWANLDDEQKMSIVRDIVDRARKGARNLLIGQSPDLANRIREAR
jgi:hypothetical protein